MYADYVVFVTFCKYRYDTGRKDTYSKENAEALVAATREIVLEVSDDKTKYMVMSRDQNAGRIHSVRNDNSTFEKVEEFKYLGTT